MTHVTGNPETSLTRALRLRAREAVNAFLLSHLSLIQKSHKDPQRPAAKFLEDRNPEGDR